MPPASASELPLHQTVFTAVADDTAYKCSHVHTCNSYERGANAAHRSALVDHVHLILSRAFQWRGYNARVHKTCFRICVPLMSF